MRHAEPVQDGATGRAGTENRGTGSATREKYERNFCQPKGRGSSQLCEAPVEVAAKALRKKMQTDCGHEATRAVPFCVRDQAGYPARHCQNVQERTPIFSTHQPYLRIDSEVSPSCRSRVSRCFVPSGPAVVAFLRARMLRQRHGVSLLVPRCSV